LGRGAEAAPALDGAIARAPTAGLYRLRGLVHDDARQIADAARCYERALELDPADHRALYQLSITYAALERRADAARVAARLVTVQKDLDALSVLSIEAMSKPTDAGVRLKLAEACDRLGKPQLATMWRKAAAACAPAAGP
jgi:tetratricopeptide (TPR) repeat protein